MTYKDKIGYWIACHGNTAILIGSLLAMLTLMIFMPGCSSEKVPVRDASVEQWVRPEIQDSLPDRCDLESPPCIQGNDTNIADVCISHGHIAEDRCGRECYVCINMSPGELICTNYYGANCVLFCGLCN